MSKVEISTVAEVCKTAQLTPAQIREIIELLQSKNEAEETEKVPAVKKQFVILISDPDNLLPKTDFAGWVLQIPEGESPATVQDRILRSAYDHNASKKGRLHPVSTLGEAIESVKAGLFKENDIWVKTRTPVLMLRTDNEIPSDQEKISFDGNGKPLKSISALTSFNEKMRELEKFDGIVAELKIGGGK